ncbi:putative cyanobacterial protein, TIGR03792 family [Rivularia sp. PCC 7116]|uniref:TIGR03792 family protein n=1 Tax=Rivularia sp. PCC 7116 TaxID=373994 RepID=UPI00029ECA69|nr:TIGR03792 family protein [Rivularia sp. PCC 7116]AFY56747.1 putative cyanobacterial protein, TIGR03792 family [Rivularia sp. PCC 7116]
MVIELLKFRISPKDREKYIQRDAEIWTAALVDYPGFLGKELWINPNDPEELVMVIRWETRQQWKSILQEEIDAITEKFDKDLKFTYEIVESSEYQVRKFPNSN